MSYIIFNRGVWRHNSMATQT